jgi:hypothetical protein
VQPVQTGVWYCPEVDFSAFDLARLQGGERIWLGVAQALDLLHGAGVPCCEPLLIGALGDMMAMSVERPTTIPELRRLPPLPDNLAEGVVIKPLEAITIQTDRGPIRPVIKRKHPRFEEDERFHAATRWAQPVAPAVSPLDTLEWAVLRRLNDNRLASARSKLGPTAGDEALCAEVCADVMVDVAEEHPAVLAGLSAEDRALLEAVLLEEAQRLLSAR